MNFYELYLQLEEEDRRTMEAHVLFDLPDVRQSHDYDCGPACVRALAKYFLGSTLREDDFIKMTKAKPDGAHPSDLVAAMRSLGLNADFHDRFTEKRLRDALDQGRPVILEIQAWGNPNQYDRLDDGHYVVAIGYDDDNVYFEDPSLKSVRGFLTYEELEDRWKEKENTGEVWHHSAIVVWKEGRPKTEKVLNKARHID